MDLMTSIYDTYLSAASSSTTISDQSAPNAEGNDVGVAYQKQLDSMMGQVRDQREKLTREVERWCKERAV
jgi:indoleamine 2,3-dioxygenase